MSYNVYWVINMNKKIIFLDVDGTISSPKNGVSETVKYAIQKARENGHYVFVCTGRNKVGVSELKDIEFDGYICSAGGYIEINNQVIYESHLDVEDLKEVRDVLDKLDVYYNMEATHMTFSDIRLNRMFALGTLGKNASNSELDRLVEQQKDNYNIHTLEEYNENPLPIHKVCFVALNRESLEVIKEKLSYKYHVIIHELFSSDTINGEFIIKGTNKGNAVREVAKYYNISIDDTIAFGDSMNDYEMIRAVKYGVVMENGSAKLKEYASSICEHIDNDGVYHELKRLNII